MQAPAHAARQRPLSTVPRARRWRATWAVPAAQGCRTRQSPSHGSPCPARRRRLRRRLHPQGKKPAAADEAAHVCRLPPAAQPLRALRCCMGAAVHLAQRAPPQRCMEPPRRPARQHSRPRRRRRAGGQGCDPGGCGRAVRRAATPAAHRGQDLGPRQSAPPARPTRMRPPRPLRPPHTLRRAPLPRQPRRQRTRVPRRLPTWQPLMPPWTTPGRPPRAPRRWRLQPRQLPGARGRQAAALRR